MTKPADGMHAIAEALEQIAMKMPHSDDLRTDHPLQGETLGGIVEQLGEISRSIGNLADAGQAIAEAITKAARDRHLTIAPLDPAD